MKIQASDTFIFAPEDVILYLYECLRNGEPTIIDFYLEGPCAKRTGLYRLLDHFCTITGYDKSKITIRTANMLEQHDEYNIQHVPEYWYEVKEIQEWLERNQIEQGGTPLFHFGHFVGRATWHRTWVGSHLYCNHRDKTLQTFHSHPNCNYVVPESDGVTDSFEMDLLLEEGCNDWNAVSTFLTALPLNADLNEIKIIQRPFIAPSNKDVYPIQHPANLNIAKICYPGIFVDIVCETRTLGDLLFISEKTWRPIISRRPFISMAPANTLANLRRLGFKTFNDFWSEEYDYYGGGKRVEMITALIDTIAEWDTEELSARHREMAPILDHNERIFRELTFDKILEATHG